MFRLISRARFAAGGVAASAAAVYTATSQHSPAAAAAAPQNRILGPKHRVILGWWPVLGARQQDDPRAKSLRTIVQHAESAGYEGIEFSVEDMKSTFYTQSTPDSTVMRDALAAAPRGYFPGGTYHILDGNESPYVGEKVLVDRPTHDFESPSFESGLRRALDNDASIGAGYATFQVFLPPQYMDTAGEYRNDEAYLTLCAQRVEVLQRLCADAGLNCYIETHIGRFSEDPEALIKVMERAPYFELNADLSHYLYRNIQKGPSLPRIMARVGHMHARLARAYGDLSADVEQGDPALDWNNKGVTYQAFEYYKPALDGGLSSRCIMGETGPMHLVKDALSLDAKLVPLWRAMADYADTHSNTPPSVAEDGPWSRHASSNIAVASSYEYRIDAAAEAEANRMLERHFSSRR